MRAVRQFLRTHRVPLIAVGLAALHSLLFWSLGPRVPLGLFIAAVMVSAWQGGMRAAVLATALSTAVLAVLGRYQAPGPEEDLVLRLGLFVLVGFIAGYLSQQCRNAIRAVDHVHDLLGGSGLAIISADAEGRVTSLNPLARALTGLGEADANGRPLAEVFRVVHGSSRQRVQLPPSGTAQELPEGALLVGQNGGETVVEGTVGPVRDGEGRSTGVMVVFRETGGRSQAREEVRQRADRFRALAGYAPAGLMVLDAEGRCVFCNPAAQAACGCTADECLGEGWSRHVRPEDRDRLIGEWLRAVVGKQPFADEFRVAARWLRLRSAPMLGDGGEVLGHVAALEDVSERRRAEEALADARRESEEHLQEWSTSEKKAEEALRKVRGQLDERGTALKRAEEALLAAQAEAEQKLAAEASRRQQAEEDLGRLREQTQRLAAEAREARDQHQALLADKGGAEESLRQELDRLAEDAAGLRQSHDRLQQLLAQKDGHEGSLRQELERLAREADEAREVHDRLQAALAAKGQAEEALRQELERLQGEAAARRQAEEALRRQAEEALRRQAEDAHGRHQAALAEKAQGEESWQHERARLQGELGERRQAEEQLRREKEFLEGVIDGSPAGIYAHDRDGRCRVWNPALEPLLGRPRADALGRTAAELFPAGDDKPRAGAAPVAEGDAPRDDVETASIGRSELLETAHAPVRDAAGEVIGGMALVRVLPMAAPIPKADELAPTAESNGRRMTGPAGPGLAAARLRDTDWLGFN
jgi:PAS domain S-box-containing protein